jgi:hypothetical protein
MAIILKDNKVNLFVFWYHSRNFLDTPRTSCTFLVVILQYQGILTPEVPADIRCIHHDPSIALQRDCSSAYRFTSSTFLVIAPYQYILTTEEVPADFHCLPPLILPLQRILTAFVPMDLYQMY